MKHIFIGGCLDGQWIEVSPEENCKKVMKRPLPDFFTVEASEEAKVFEEETYFRMLVHHDDKGRLEVFTLNGEQFSLRMLLENYRPGVMVSGVAELSMRPGINVKTDSHEEIYRLQCDGRDGQPVQVIFPTDPQRRSYK